MSEEQKPDREAEKPKSEQQEDKKEKKEKPVIIKAEAYKTIILYASRYANAQIPRADWKEIYGVLIGHTDDDFVYIEQAEALTYGHDTDVQLDTRHYVFIDEIQSSLGKDKWICGWFHSHPGLDLFFSYTDLINQLGFQQNNDDFVGLVFDHTLLGKKKEEKIGDNILTKYDTGFEIYKLNDVSMDINAPDFDNNYHSVDYIVEGLNKFFFANVMVELSALSTAEKPLQAAYGEQANLESNYKDPNEVEKSSVKPQTAVPSQVNNSLEAIPLSEDMFFDMNQSLYEESTKKQDPTVRRKEEAEEFIFQGNQAFNEGDAFTGVENFKKGINIYKDLKDFNKAMALLQTLSEKCISTNHDNLAEDFAKELHGMAEEKGELFYLGEGNYLLGYLTLKEGWNTSLQKGLEMLQEASVSYEKAGDFAGAGQCYYKIGTIYHSRLNKLYNAALFYIQAIKSFNQALSRNHPLRKSLWAKAENLSNRLIDMKDIVENLILNIEDPAERNKIKRELSSV